MICLRCVIEPGNVISLGSHDLLAELMPLPGRATTRRHLVSARRRGLRSSSVPVSFRIPGQHGASDIAGHSLPGLDSRAFDPDVLDSGPEHGRLVQTNHKPRKARTAAADLYFDMPCSIYGDSLQNWLICARRAWSERSHDVPAHVSSSCDLIWRAKPRIVLHEITPSGASGISSGRFTRSDGPVLAAV